MNCLLLMKSGIKFPALKLALKKHIGFEDFWDPVWTCLLLKAEEMLISRLSMPKWNKVDSNQAQLSTTIMITRFKNKKKENKLVAEGK